MFVALRWTKFQTERLALTSIFDLKPSKFSKYAIVDRRTTTIWDDP